MTRFNHTTLALSLSCLMLLAAVFTAPVSVLAQPTEAEVKALFTKSQEDFAAKRYDAALTSLKQIAEAYPDPLITYNIARCHEELEQWDEAEAAFESALADENLADGQREQAVTRLAAIKEKKAALAEAKRLEEEEERRRKAEEEANKLPPEPTVTLAQGYAAPHVGVIVPQAFNELGSWPLFGLELGYVLPFDAGSIVRPLVVSFDVLYTAPGAEGSGQDPNLGEMGDGYTWELSEQMLILELAIGWRFMPLGETLSAFAQIGPRLYLLESVLTAEGAGSDFGEHRETDTNTGFVLGGGLDYQLGPGSLYGGLDFSLSGLDQRITGEANTGNFSLDLGYRVHF